jgi:hypothetical protein
MAVEPGFRHHRCMNTLLTTLSSGIGTIASLGIAAGLLTVALTSVRRSKPAAVLPIASSAAINLVTAIITPVAYAFLPLMMTRSGGGMDDYQMVFSAVSLGLTLVHTMSGVLLILGLVKLASPDGPPRFPA